MKNLINWKQVKLKDISIKIIGGGTPSTSKAEYWNGEIAWTTSAHLTEREIQTGQKYITKKGLLESSTCIVPKQNILIATRVGIGKVAINKIDIAISQDLTGILIDKKSVMSEYIYWALTRKRNKLKALAQGSTIKGILRKDVAKIQIPLPPLPEQKKIVEILSTVDQSLEKATKVLEEAEKLKKALVLTFFKKGINHKKFKMSELGDIPNEWEIVKFSDVIDVIKRGPFGGSIKKEIFVNDGYKVYEQKNVIGNNFSLGNYYIDENKYGELKAFSIRNSDILLTAAGTIGKVALVPSNIRPGIINQALIKITPNNKKIIPRYMYELLLTDSFKNKISGRSHGATMKNISSVKEIKSIKMPLPPIIEQKRIVEILETVNQKVLLHKNRIKRMTKLRKSLMNDLLTGRKRVRLES